MHGKALRGKRAPLRRKRTPAAWPAFESKLAEVLGALEEDQYLVISAKRGWAYVQFAAQGSFGLRAECVSSNYLDKAHALRASQVAALRKLGWSAPTGTHDEILAKHEKGGSPNFFRDFDRPVPWAEVSRMAVHTLTSIFEIPHPGYLQYKAFEKKLGPILLPTLGLKRVPSPPPPEKPRADSVVGLRKLVLKAIRDVSGEADLDFDKDGDLSLRFGSAVVIVRVLDDPPCVRVFSPVLGNVTVDDRLGKRVNELNAKVRHVRLFVVEGTVFAATEVFTLPFVAEHVTKACWLLGSLADEIDDMLQKEFGGRTSFGEFRNQATVN